MQVKEVKNKKRHRRFNGRRVTTTRVPGGKKGKDDFYPSGRSPLTGEASQVGSYISRA